MSVGAVVGLDVGLFVGDVVESGFGGAVGVDDERRLGEGLGGGVLGSAVGVAVGLAVIGRLVVGVLVGTFVGSAVGPVVGDAVGDSVVLWNVGLAVGRDVMTIAADGDCVGSAITESSFRKSLR